MKNYLVLIFVFIFNFSFGQYQTTIKKSIQMNFTSQSQKEYSFVIDDLPESADARLIIYGSDYDYDNDDDYTDFSIAVNGYKLIYAKQLKEQGLPVDGQFGKITFNIANYLKEGINTVMLQNTEDANQVDYAHIKYLEVKLREKENTASTGQTEGDYQIARKSIYKKFTSQTREEYSFEIGDPSTFSGVRLIIRAADYDYDNDGDFTDFTISINDYNLITQDQLKEQGLESGGRIGEISFAVDPYLQMGTNTIVLHNTENSQQVDYAQIYSIILTAENKNSSVESKSGPGANRNRRKSIYRKFTAQSSLDYTFVVNDRNNIAGATLIIRGSDYDYDNDGDYTDFRVSINGSNLLIAEPLRDYGMPADGEKGTIAFSIASYLKIGENVIVLENTEDKEQVDYTIIDYVEVITGGNASSQKAIAINKVDYEEVRIGSQVWMAENLNVSHFKTGEPIPHARTDEEWKTAGEYKEPAWCYYDNSTQNEKVYGKLYNWYAVHTGELCPAGWRVPTTDDWSELQDYLNNGEVYFYGGGEAGNKLKEAGTRHWDYPNEKASNSTGYTALPGGERDIEGTYKNLGTLGNWWTNTEDWSSEHRASSITLKHNWEELEVFYSSKKFGHSVRCIKK